VAMHQVEQEPAGSATSIRAGELEVGYIDGGSGVPLVLVHGGESDRTRFATLRAHLGAGIRAISYDQRDSGITVNPPVPYTLGDLADDLVALLDALGLQRAHVLGTSFGGAVAQHAALRHPDRVASLILVATTPSFALCPRTVNELFDMSHDDRQKAVKDFFVTPEGQTELHTRAAQTLAYRDPEKSGRRHDAARQHEVRDRLGEITAPTLIVHGTSDLLGALRRRPPDGATDPERRAAFDRGWAPRDRDGVRGADLRLGARVPRSVGGVSDATHSRLRQAPTPGSAGGDGRPRPADPGVRREPRRAGVGLLAQPLGSGRDVRQGCTETSRWSGRSEPSRLPRCSGRPAIGGGGDG
jgi:pimeloyl-ACP methyl ester carboxylesterase